MIKLNLPDYPHKLKKQGDAILIWDNVRHKYITLTPEEWVRQHFVAYLTAHLGYPEGRIGNEITLRLNGQNKRCDTIVYDTTGAPLMLIEYKAPHIAITQEVFDQIVRYNICCQVPYIVVSNGITHYCCHIDYGTKAVTFLPEIPIYNGL